MAEEDELQLFRFLERFELEVYPVRIPEGFRPALANESAVSRLPDDAAYLCAARLGPVLVDKVKRGPDKGRWRVDEVRSPVIYFERSRRNSEGELLSGRFWAELDVTPQTGRKGATSDRFRKLFTEIETWLKKTYRRSEPVGFLIGPNAARLHKEGLVLRTAEHRGRTVIPNR